MEILVAVGSLKLSGSSFGFVCVPQLLRSKLSFSSGLEAFAQSQAQKCSEIWQLALVAFSPPDLFP